MTPPRSLTPAMFRIPGDVRLVTLEQIKSEYAQAVLEREAWNITKAAKVLGIERITLNRMIKRYKLKRPKEE